jgi:hypothetical protein
VTPNRMMPGNNGIGTMDRAAAWCYPAVCDE